MTHPDYALSPGLKERYGVLLDIGRILTGTLRPGELYRAIYEQTSRVLETTGFYISLYDAQTDYATVVFFADRGEIGAGLDQEQLNYRGADSVAIREARPVLKRLDHPDEALLLLGTDREQVTRASVSAPMLRDGKVLGIISAQSYRADSYDQEDLELLAAVADLAAVALGNSHYVAELERRQREAERLEEIGRALTASLELTEVLERVAAAVLDLFEADSAHVWLFEGLEARVAAASGAKSAAFPIGARLAITDEFRKLLIERRESAVIHDIESHPGIDPQLRQALPVNSVLVAPLIVDGGVIGALSLGHAEKRCYAEQEIRLLERVSNQAAVAVENARLHEQIRALSLTDPLTGLPNRRHMELFLAKEFAAAQRGRPLTVVLFDLDRFKEYNDTYGHQAGDEALRHFGDVLADSTRAMNLGARYGGDEFISILADSTSSGGIVLASRISDAVSRHPAMRGIGVSAGVASYTADMVSPNDLIRAADRDLYLRKRTG